MLFEDMFQAIGVTGINRVDTGFRRVLYLGSGVPYPNAFLLDLFLKGTTIKYKSILFSLWLLQSPEVVHGGFASAQGGRGALKPCLYWHPHSWNRVPGYIDYDAS